MAEQAVLVEDVHKSFGETRALDGVSLAVPAGSVLGLLGANGAGKTTLVRIMTTLLAADSGRVTVAGHDVAREPLAVRRAIGLSGQYASVDDRLSGRENLELAARLYHLGREESERRVDELIERLELGDVVDSPTRMYSGGMRRRLDLAASLVSKPEILFLDEPSTGLDPSSRARLWAEIEALGREGTTILLTTQYLEEADHLADSIAIIDSGRVIAEGTSSELKGAAGHWFVELVVVDNGRAQAAADAIVELAEADARIRIHHHSGRIRVPVGRERVHLDDVTARLDAAGIAIAELSLRQPTLDDVFMALTGSAPAEASEPG
jgi:ABC-2 type transport system ATP-binding protein